MSVAFAAIVSVPPLTQLKLAREIASDMRDLEEVLALYDVSTPQWEALQRSTRFQALLKTAMEEWQSVTNTPERVKMKSLAFVEEALPEFFARVHDQKETLSSKNEVLKTISRLAGIGGPVEGAISGERMVITINLGEDHQLQFRSDKPMIEGEYRETDGEEVTSESNDEGIGFEFTEAELEQYANMLEGVDLDANDELGAGYDEGDDE
jgi:uncharacterized protein (DUF1786 family)